MRLRRFAAVLVCVVAPLLAGCLQSSTLVKLNPDGSGTIEQTISMKKGLLEAADTSEEPFSVEQAKAAVAGMGPGVAFVSSARIDTPGRKGLKAVYSFKDIRTLALTELMIIPAGIDIGDQSDPPMALAFTQRANGHALLTIKNDVAVAGDAEPSPFGELEDEETAKTEKAMLAGMTVDFAIQVGHLVRTNIPYVAGRTVTVLSIDFDQVFADRAALGTLRKTKTLAEAMVALQRFRGIKLNVERELTIEFTK